MNSNSQNIPNVVNNKSSATSSEPNSDKKSKKRHHSDIEDLQEKENIFLENNNELQKRRKFVATNVNTNTNNINFSFSNNNITFPNSQQPSNNSNSQQQRSNLLSTENSHSFSRKRDRQQFEEADDMILNTPTTTISSSAENLNWFGADSNALPQQDSMEEEDFSGPSLKRMRTKEQLDEEEAKLTEEKRQLYEYLMKQQFRHHRNLKENEMRAVDQALPDYQDINNRLKQIHMERKGSDRL